MGRTDSQFKSFICLILYALKDFNEETDQEKRKKKMDKILGNFKKYRRINARHGT